MSSATRHQLRRRHGWQCAVILAQGGAPRPKRHLHGVCKGGGRVRRRGADGRRQPRGRHRAAHQRIVHAHQVAQHLAAHASGHLRRVAENVCAKLHGTWLHAHEKLHGWRPAVVHGIAHRSVWRGPGPVVAGGIGTRRAQLVRMALRHLLQWMHKTDTPWLQLRQGPFCCSHGGRSTSAACCQSADISAPVS